jgi:hypothetical protein
VEKIITVLFRKFKVQEGIYRDEGVDGITGQNRER